MAVNTTQPAAAPVVARRKYAASISWRKRWGKIGITLLALLALFIFLVPMASMVTISLKTMTQITEPGAPIWPAEPAAYEYTDPATGAVQTLGIYKVTMEDGSTQELAMLKPGRRTSTFIDPANPAEPIVWKGNWRGLERPWSFAPAWSNYTEAWKTINFPLLFRNTLAIAVLGIIGTLISCILVAYGFSRFRFKGRDILFTLLIATIFLPTSVTIVPTYAFFQKIGWVGTWLPLIVPHYFANAYNVFLLRQYFLTIPREIDEAAMMDGASPLRILTAIIVPMSKPVIVAVALFHLVFAWNDYFGPLIYLSTRPDLQPIAVGLSRFNGIYGSQPPLVQASALMASLLPIVIFFMAQGVFMQGVVVTGVEK